ncbi:MAG: serine hydrolase [Thermoleophilaceae bacterium]
MGPHPPTSARERASTGAPSRAGSQALRRLPRAGFDAADGGPGLGDARARREHDRRARLTRVRRRHTVAVIVLLAAIALVAFVVTGMGDGGTLRQAATGVTDEADRPPPPPAAPAPAQVQRAAAYARARRGNASFAVVDTDGQVRGIDTRRSFASASVVKAMILVAYLDLVERRRTSLTDTERLQLAEMIRRSDNASATQLVNAVGSSGLRRVARRAGMRGTKPQVQPWGLTETNAEDQARLFARIDELVPSRYRSYARRLLRTIIPEHRWGIPRTAPRDATVLFKGGWLPDEDGAWRVHQIAKVERGPKQLAVAVMTDGNPSQSYGEDTVRGVAARLLK